MEYNIVHCRICGEPVVVSDMDALELPICSRLQCFAVAFPDDYKELMDID